MKKSVPILFLLFFILCVSVAAIHEGVLDKISDKLNLYNRSQPQEKIYIHTDKPLYNPGEDIWFNVFLLQGTTLKPSSTSSVAYVELTDPKGNIVKRLQLAVVEGTARGDFALPKNATGGIYLIKAYTRWMTNFGGRDSFVKEIQVQQFITPRLLLKIDFEKKAYGPGDTVVARLKAGNLREIPIRQMAVLAKLKLNGSVYSLGKFTTDDEGEAELRLVLPDTLNTTDGIVEAQVEDSGVSESISRSVPVVLNQISLSLFPEGGLWIAGARQRMAFKAMNEFGKGADIDGVVVRHDGQVVTHFSSLHLGMGEFEMTPELNDSYKVKITRPAGIKETYPLPQALAGGMSLSVRNQSDSVVAVTVFSDHSRTVHLMAHVRSIVFNKQYVSLSQGENTIRVTTRNMPAGVAAFTLFEESGIPVCERLIFVNPDKLLQISVTTDKKKYLPRERVGLTVTTKLPNGNPVPARVSLSVVDDQLLTALDDKEDHLLSWMLLSSDLKGKIEEPAFYFKSDEPKAKPALDLLLRTHGWRRFTWKEVTDSLANLTALPENERQISGVVLDKNRTGTVAEVYLLEVNHGQRLIKVMSNNHGQFVFRNVDATAVHAIITRLPNTVELDDQASGTPGDISGTRRFNRTSQPLIEEMEVQETQTQNTKSLIENDIALEMDVKQLSEVVVTAQGIEREQKSLGYAQTTLNGAPGMLLATPSVGIALQGRTPGIYILNSSGIAGSSSTINIRGTSTITGSSSPLWIVDGVPLDGEINSNFSPGNQLDPEQINAISILRSPTAVAQFGSQAANGVLVITTKDRFPYMSFGSRSRKPRYSVVSITPRAFTLGREYYVAPPEETNYQRKDFRTTIFWKADMVTDSKGRAEITFFNNDATSTFRAVAEGISGHGLIGRTENTYHTELPFSMDMRPPDEIGFQDTVQVPIRITNRTKAKLSGKLSITFPVALRIIKAPGRNLEVPAETSMTEHLIFTTSGKEGAFPITISLENNKYKDNVTETIHVRPVGFPMQLSFAGKSVQGTFPISIKDVEPGSIKAHAVFTTDILQELFTGAEGMLREPHGCFEQVSSSTFPNILALQLLRKAGKSNPALESRAKHLIASGYDMLKGYEIKGGGFEWFGHPPAHEALSAFGLIEFKEMSTVYDGVSSQLIDRTRNWLLERRDGRGTFKQVSGKYGFSAAPAAVNNAYLVYALSETGTKNILPEYLHSLREAMTSGDMYRMALMANAASNLDQLTDYLKLIKIYKEHVSQHDFTSLSIESSIVQSAGKSLTTETVAFWALALMKSPAPDFVLIKSCLEFIGSQKSFDRYGSTQATYLALKAIAEYHTLVQSTRTDGTVSLMINRQDPQTRSYRAEDKHNINFEFSDQLAEGNNEVGFKFDTKEPLPYSVNVGWNTLTPVSQAACPLRLETRLTEEFVKVKGTVRMAIRLMNATNHGLPMSMAIIGIPAGMSLQPWQLKELKKQEKFDFYEINGNKLILYYREMAPAQVREVNLDLKADVPGIYKAGASSAYLYYADELKHWTRGNRIEIIP
ncbi:MAG TPA: MG2 domain-containing protein [Cyclobacteriaceae bacterium]|nr:MG2 domain-containing protein [Cyclobacteriaceae bacterium]